MTPSNRFAMSTEQECLTVVLKQAEGAASTIGRLFEILRGLAPTLPATAGQFNAYGRIYVDCGHIELAACECDSPYVLASVVERQQRLVSKAITQLEQEGHRLLLANNNHSGLLQANCPIWGAHENHMTEQHPSKFGQLILPFLVTRIYAGAGGIEFPSGNFLAAVRPIRMEHATGGGTTERRAIHSTCREEHHMGESPKQFRYHLILGDGHRSSFNLALQFGATALALKAIFYDRRLPEQIDSLGLPKRRSWPATLRAFNLLAKPGQPLSIDPLVIRAQQVYLDGARRYFDSLRDESPAWIPRLLEDWERTLTAMQETDRGWLSPRLDTFAKYEFYSAVLRQGEKTWGDLPNCKTLFNELALLDHSYHEFCSANSVFNRLERAGLLRHRVSDPVEPGAEAEPFTPETDTRAQARAVFIRDNAKRGSFVMDWSWVDDRVEGRVQRMTDPFARQFEPWKRKPDRPGRPTSGTAQLDAMVNNLEQLYDRGQYELAHQHASQLEGLAAILGRRHQQRLLRLRAWIEARRGFLESEPLLQQLYEGRTLNVLAVSDYCFAMRFRGLVPHASIQPWLDRGFQLLAGTEHVPQEPAGTPAFRDHAAAALCAENRHEEACELLERACEASRLAQTEPRLQGRLLAALGDVNRVLGKRLRASRLLRQARVVQESSGFHSDLAEFTLTALARLQRRSRAIERLATARQTLRQHSHQMGLARLLLLETRITRDPQLAAENLQRVEALRQQLPALGGCQRLEMILTSWDAWSQGENPESLPTGRDEFWGV